MSLITDVFKMIKGLNLPKTEIHLFEVEESLAVFSSDVEVIIRINEVNTKSNLVSGDLPMGSISTLQIDIWSLDFNKVNDVGEKIDNLFFRDYWSLGIDVRVVDKDFIVNGTYGAKQVYMNNKRFTKQIIRKQKEI